jgi:hypothetical protein
VYHYFSLLAPSDKISQTRPRIVHCSFEDFASKYPTYPRDVVSLYNLYLHLGIYHGWTALRLEAIAALGCYVLLGREPARVRALFVHESC